MKGFSKGCIFAALSTLLWAFALSAFAQIDYGAYNIIVQNNASFTAGAHVHRAGYIGGTLTAGAEISFGQDKLDTKLALIALGNVSAPNGIDMSSSKYYLPSETVVSIKNPGAPTSDATLADGSTLKTADNSPPTLSPGATDPSLIFAKLSQESSRLASLTPSALHYDANPANQNKQPDSNPATLDFIKNSDKIIIKVIAGQTNILNLGYNAFSGVSQIQFQGFDTTTKLVINYFANSWNTPVTFNFQTLGLDSNYSDQVLWNIREVQNLTIGSNSSTFHGSILATQTNITWAANDMDGQLIAASLTDTVQHQYHNYSYFGSDLPPIPEPSTYALFGAGSLAALALLRRRLKA